MKTILIVEDNALNMELTCQVLEDDYALLQARDGEAGIAMAEEHGPNLILMDLSLPKVDGWEAIRRLRAKWNTCRIPIIALSAHASRGAIDQAKKAGCDEYLTKPIDENLLLETIARLIGEPGEAP
jgi:two-component system cell cycle response regulator DivK